MDMLVQPQGGATAIRQCRQVGSRAAGTLAPALRWGHAVQMPGVVGNRDQGQVGCQPMPFPAFWFAVEKAIVLEESHHTH